MRKSEKIIYVRKTANISQISKKVVLVWSFLISIYYIHFVYYISKVQMAMLKTKGKLQLNLISHL